MHFFRLIFPMKFLSIFILSSIFSYFYHFWTNLQLYINLCFLSFFHIINQLEKTNNYTIFFRYLRVLNFLLKQQLFSYVHSLFGGKLQMLTSYNILGTIGILLIKIFYRIVFGINPVFYINLFSYVFFILIGIKFDFLILIRKYFMRINKKLLGYPFWNGLNFDAANRLTNTHYPRDENIECFVHIRESTFFQFLYQQFFTFLVLLRLFIFAESYVFIFINTILTYFLLINKYLLFCFFISFILIYSYFAIFSSDFTFFELQTYSFRQMELFNPNNGECIAPTWWNAKLLAYWVVRDYQFNESFLKKMRKNNLIDFPLYNSTVIVYIKNYLYPKYLMLTNKEFDCSSHMLGRIRLAKAYDERIPYESLLEVTKKQRFLYPLLLLLFIANIPTPEFSYLDFGGEPVILCPIGKAFKSIPEIEYFHKRAYNHPFGAKLEKGNTFYIIPNSTMHTKPLPFLGKFPNKMNEPLDFPIGKNSNIRSSLQLAFSHRLNDKESNVFKEEFNLFKETAIAYSLPEAYSPMYCDIFTYNLFKNNPSFTPFIAFLGDYQNGLFPSAYLCIANCLSDNASFNQAKRGFEVILEYSSKVVASPSTRITEYQKQEHKIFLDIINPIYNKFTTTPPITYQLTDDPNIERNLKIAEDITLTTFNNKSIPIAVAQIDFLSNLYNMDSILVGKRHIANIHTLPKHLGGIITKDFLNDS